jgi:hypothetical protein
MAIHTGYRLEARNWSLAHRKQSYTGFAMARRRLSMSRTNRERFA